MAEMGGDRSILGERVLLVYFCFHKGLVSQFKFFFLSYQLATSVPTIRMRDNK
jgi:hypothetical protein